MKIKKGDNIIVISGAEKGKTGKVREVLRRRNLVVVEGVNLKKKHERPRRAREKGQVIDVAMPIQVSNVSLIEGGKPVRARMARVGEKWVRVSRKTGQEV